MRAADDREIIDLLKRGEIKAFSADTSCFIGTGKIVYLHSAQVRQLETRGNDNDYIPFLLSYTVEKELHEHLVKDIKTYSAQPEGGTEKGNDTFGTENPTREQLMLQMALGSSAEEAAKRVLADFRDRVRYIPLPDQELMAKTSLIDDYFAGRPPFGKDRWKEIKDAFALNALKAKAKDLGGLILTASRNTKDWKPFCDELDSNLCWVEHVKGILFLIARAGGETDDLKANVAAWLEIDRTEELRRYLKGSVKGMPLNIGDRLRQDDPVSREISDAPLGMGVPEFLHIKQSNPSAIRIINPTPNEDGSVTFAAVIPMTLQAQVSYERETFSRDTKAGDLVPVDPQKGICHADVEALTTARFHIPPPSADNQALQLLDAIADMDVQSEYGASWPIASGSPSQSDASE